MISTPSIILLKGESSNIIKRHSFGLLWVGRVRNFRNLTLLLLPSSSLFNFLGKKNALAALPLLQALGFASCLLACKANGHA